MLSFDAAREALDAAIESLPCPILRELNGGVILLPQAKSHSKSPGLYILGEYHVEPNGLGRYITLYYGSFRAVFPNLSDDRFVAELTKTLHHELTHHLESLAGDRSLETQDALDLSRYLSGDWE